MGTFLRSALNNAHSKFCCYCKRTGHHNRCTYTVCPKEFAGSTETIAINQSSTNVYDSGQLVVADGKTTDTVTPTVDTDHMLLINGKRVLLQTAIVPVFCTNGSVVSARILLDSTSQGTFMMEQLW